MSRAFRIALPLVALAVLLGVWVLAMVEPAPAVVSESLIEESDGAAADTPKADGRRAAAAPARQVEPPADAEPPVENPARGLIEVRMRPPGLPVDATFVPSEPSEWIDREERSRRRSNAPRTGPRIPAPPLPEQ